VSLTPVAVSIERVEPFLLPKWGKRPAKVRYPMIQYVLDLALLRRSRSFARPS